MTDINQRVAEYIAIRDKIKEREAAHKAELKPMKDTLEQVGGLIRQFMKENNINEGVKTSSGTCYLTTRWSATLADSAVFQQFVKDHAAFDLIDWKANATAVRDYVGEHKTLPPGVNLSSIEQIGVRRA